jgi:hypothetical protein
VSLPFTTAQFLGVFADYNATVWPAQILLHVLALACIGALFKPQQWTGRLIASVVAFFWMWMAVAYHFYFFSSINPAAWLFGSAFLFEGVLLLWSGAVRNQFVISRVRTTRKWIGAALLVFSLTLYPLFGYVLGQRFPAFPTFGLPCPTTIFSIGILMFMPTPLARPLLIVPVLWTLIGSLAAIHLGITEDFSLIIAGAVGLGAILRAPQ